MDTIFLPHTGLRHKDAGPRILIYPARIVIEQYMFKPADAALLRPNHKEVFPAGVLQST